MFNFQYYFPSVSDRWFNSEAPLRAGDGGGFYYYFFKALILSRA